MVNPKAWSPQVETRAVEQSLSRTPQSRKAFFREVLCGRRSGLSRSGKIHHDQCVLVKGGGGGGGEGEGGGRAGGRGPKNPLEEATANLWVHAEGPPRPG